MADSPQGISLHDFLSRLKVVIMREQSLLQQWVIAEISDLRYNRHCYMQLLEKDTAGNTIATVRATIWHSTFLAVNSKFQAATGQPLANGLKVMLQVSANFSEQYGLSLNVTDISPEFTLGDMQRLRREIIERLTREGLIDLNKELSIPATPQRIAVISAAGNKKRNPNARAVRYVAVFNVAVIHIRGGEPFPLSPAFCPDSRTECRYSRRYGVQHSSYPDPHCRS